VVHCDHASILHRYENMAPQRLWGHDLDFLGSRDVIGHVTIRLAVATFYGRSIVTMRLSCTVREI